MRTMLLLLLLLLLMPLHMPPPATMAGSKRFLLWIQTVFTTTVSSAPTDIASGITHLDANITRITDLPPAGPLGPADRRAPGDAVPWVV